MVTLCEHELGHTLGLDYRLARHESKVYFNDEFIVRAVNITKPRPFAGAVIALGPQFTFGDHISDWLPEYLDNEDRGSLGVNLMALNIVPGTRVHVSDIDALTIAEFSMLIAQIV